MGFKISNVWIEYQNKPLGLDERKPRFSWRMESDMQNTRQEKCRIKVVEEGAAGKTVWDSGSLRQITHRGSSMRGNP